MGNVEKLLLLIGITVLIESRHGAFLRGPSFHIADSIREGKLNGEDADARSEVPRLTSLIESGQLEEARTTSEVKSLPGLDFPLKSYSGFFTVNATYNSNMFFWFFPALTGETKNVPLLLWLQGGPGSSSMFGLFTENGPLWLNKDLSVKLRNYTWNREFALLYIDNPVGTGFSFTDDNRGYARDQDDVGRDLYSALSQFFALFSEYRGNPFFLTGESYAGKYIPAIARKIHSMGPKAQKAGFNLQGLAIGDGFCDPRNMANYGDFLYQIGLIDAPQREYFLAEQAKFVALVDEGAYDKAFRVMDDLIDGDYLNQTFGQKSFFTKSTGLTDYYNYLDDFQPDQGRDSYSKFLELNATRAALHVGVQPRNRGTVVYKHLINDTMRSVKPWIEQLLDADYLILFYSGQLDIIVAVPLTDNFLHKLEWKSAAKYRMAPRRIYKVSPSDKTVAGYIREMDNLVFATIRNAGHMVPTDQPKVALDLITKFVKGIRL